MQRDIVLHIVKNIVYFENIFSALHAGQVQNSFIPDLGSMDVRDHSMFYPCRSPDSPRDFHLELRALL